MWFSHRILTCDFHTGFSHGIFTQDSHMWFSHKILTCDFHMGFSHFIFIHFSHVIFTSDFSHVIFTSEFHMCFPHVMFTCDFYMWCSGEYNKVPLMIGSNLDEGLLLQAFQAAVRQPSYYYYFLYPIHMKESIQNKN